MNALLGTAAREVITAIEENGQEQDTLITTLHIVERNFSKGEDTKVHRFLIPFHASDAIATLESYEILEADEADALSEFYTIDGNVLTVVIEED